MALLDQRKGSALEEVRSLREQGLTDNVILAELANRGYSQDQIHMAISQLDSVAPPEPSPEEAFYPTAPGAAPGYPSAYPPSYPSPASSTAEEKNVYERMEEIAESLIDEKWDDLIAEVKKIVDWKQKVEERQVKMQNDLDKLKENFSMLHQGVLGKLDEYDTRMRDVGTELKAVGKVFKDVIPEFVENVKELSDTTKKLKGKKEQ
ncbi:hypothetical protein J4228_04230 [Candidatus Woesearchaeota archaeon]|nr:hypothetical protein [Candidatus Woesearchaeota archaeon]